MKHNRNIKVIFLESGVQPPTTAGICEGCCRAQTEWVKHKHIQTFYSLRSLRDSQLDKKCFSLPHTLPDLHRQHWCLVNVHREGLMPNLVCLVSENWFDPLFNVISLDFAAGVFTCHYATNNPLESLFKDSLQSSAPGCSLWIGIDITDWPLVPVLNLGSNWPWCCRHLSLVALGNNNSVTPSNIH